MRRPGGTIAIMFGMPSRLAHDEPPSRDEDQLDRERDDDREQESDFFDGLYERLRDGDERAVYLAQHLATCLQRMAHAASRDNDEELEHWWRKGRELLDTQPPEMKGDDDER